MEISISVSINNVVNSASDLVPAGHVGYVYLVGQSLSTGDQTVSLLSAASLDNAKMIHNPRPLLDQTPANTNNPPDPTLITTTPDLTEVNTGTMFETPLSGIAEQLDSTAGQDIYYSTWGRGGTALADLNQNNYHFANPTGGAALIENLTGLTPYCLGIVMIHGEADITASTTRAAYKSELIQLMRDLERFVKYQSGSDGDIKLIVTQTAATTAGANAPEIQMAQLEASFEANFILRTMYQHPYVDWAHLTNQGSRDCGNDIGLSIISGDNSIRPISVSESGGTITITVSETGLTTDSGITPDANNGFRLDSGTITSVTINDSSIDIDYTGSPTWISCAQNMTLTNTDFPNESQSDIWDGTNRLCNFQLPLTWSAPSYSAEPETTYSHSTTTDDDTIINTKGFVTWKRFDLALVNSGVLHCYGKSNNDSTIDGVSPTADTINGVDCMKFAGSTSFDSDRADVPTGDYTHIIVASVVNTGNQQIFCTNDGSARQFYITTNANRIQYTSGSAGTDWQNTVNDQVFLYVVAYNYKTQEFKTRFDGGSTITKAGHATASINPIKLTSAIDGELMNSGSKINGTTNTLCDRITFARDLIEDGTISAIETILKTRYGIT